MLARNQLVSRVTDEELAIGSARPRTLHRRDGGGEFVVVKDDTLLPAMVLSRRGWKASAVQSGFARIG